MWWPSWTTVKVDSESLTRPPLRPFSYYAKQLLLPEARLKQKLSSLPNSKNACKVNTYHSTQSCSSWDHSCPACSLTAVSRMPPSVFPITVLPILHQGTCVPQLLHPGPLPSHPILPLSNCTPTCRFKVKKKTTWSLQNWLTNQSTPLAQSQLEQTSTSASITHASHK